MTGSTFPTLVVLTALLAVGCSMEYETTTSHDREAPVAAAEGSPEEAGDRAADAPEPGEPALLRGLDAERATPPTEPEPTLPGESGPPPAPAAPASAPAISAPPVEPEPTAVEPTPLPSTSVPPAGSEQPLIRLSAGVALAQSLPTGTTMGFSVDYQFSGGAPGSSPYVWVIKPAKGQTIKQPVQLQPQGTLYGFFPPLRPDNGPFSTHIEDAHGNRLSKSLPLR